jgi:signal transduction histidine kinase
MQYLAASSYYIGQQIIQTVLTGSDFPAMLSQIAGKMGELFHVDVSLIVSGNFNSLNSIQLGCWHEEHFSLLNQEILSRFFAYPLFKEEISVDSWITSDRETKPIPFVDEQLKTILPVRALLVMVTRFQGIANGMIWLGKSKPYQWTDSEQELLKKVSESVAIAISQVQLKQQAQTRSRYQTLLYNLSRQISHSSDLDSILNLAVAEIGNTLEIERSLILTLKYKDPLFTNWKETSSFKGAISSSQPNRQLCPKATIQLAHLWSASEGIWETTETYSFSLADSPLCQEALYQAPEPLAIAENAVFPDFSDSQIASVIVPNDCSALLMMPLMGMASDSKPQLVMGFLVLQHSQPRLWLPDELDLINWIGIQISTSIIHHQTLSQVQSIVDERTAQLKWSLDVQAKLSEKMRQQIEQLRQLNELKDDFLSSMSHELKTPLTSMKMAIKMLRQPDLPEAMRERYLNILEQEWNREYNLIKDLLTLQQLESGELTVCPQQLNLEEVINQLAQSFRERWQTDKGLTLETELSESPLAIYIDPESLHNILNELLLNAGKYSEPDTIVRLSASRRRTFTGNEVTMIISNYGTGISEEELPNIFDKFRRGKGVTDRAVPGTGLGLALVKYLVEHLNGTIEVASELLEEEKVYLTTFTLKFTSKV